ncbi:3168_t:CDS:2, partial [Paraglomus occultum]
MTSTYTAPQDLQKADAFFKETPAQQWSDFAAFTRKQASNKFRSILGRYAGSLVALSKESIVPESIREYCIQLHKAATSAKKEHFNEIAKHIIKVKATEDRINRLKKEVTTKAALVGGMHVAVALDSWFTEDKEQVQEAQENLEEEHKDQSQDGITTPPPIPIDATKLLISPNKRAMSDEGVQQYMHDVNIIVADDLTQDELTADVGEETAKRITSRRNTSPAIWTAVEAYVDGALETQNTTFEKTADKNVDLFKLYCKKVLEDFFNMVDLHPNMSRKIGERKYMAYHVVPLFKYYERTFGTIDFDWAETHVSSAKMVKSDEGSGIVLADAKGTRMLDGLEVWHLEVAGPPKNWIRRHVLGDSKKTLRTDTLNLLRILEDRLDCDVALGSKIQVFSMLGIDTRITLYSLRMLQDGRFLATELATAIIPFTHSGRMQMKAVLRMVAIVHDELTKQEKLLEEIDHCVQRPQGKVT